MTGLLLALQFLTILPIKINKFKQEKMARALAYFPIVGLLLGLALVGLNALLIWLEVFPLLANIILVITLIILTGGMHLDGLADSADAFLSGKDKKEMLEIMRDPHIGVMGALSLLSVILLKIGLFFSLAPAIKPIAFILMCILSRWSAVMAMYLFPYARQEGKAKLFMQGLNFNIFMIALTTVLLFSLLIWNLKGLLALAMIAGCAYLLNKLITRKIGGITGDTLGATIELMEVVTLLTVCLT